MVCGGLVTVPRSRLDGDKGLHGRHDVTNMMSRKCSGCNNQKYTNNHADFY